MIHVNRHAFTLDDFRKRAPVILSELGGRPVYLRGDSRISYGNIVSTMSVLKGAGVERIGLVTEPDLE
jgi:biopolymer transport protein TolR